VGGRNVKAPNSHGQTVLTITISAGKKFSEMFLPDSSARELLANRF
jgi:hypothetical protein